jgi:hypothetical protein
MSKIRKSQLALAQREKLLVKFARPFEQGTVKGYVLDIGPTFFLVVVVGDDGVRFNGFSCFRLMDVRRLKVPHKYAPFIEAAQKKLGERIPRKPPIVVDSLQELLLSAGRRFPLVTVYREKFDPDVCYIGRVADVSNNRVSLLEIGPDAGWDHEPESYRLAEITRVDFGGQYEEALHLVGGTPTNRVSRAARS